MGDTVLEFNGVNFNRNMLLLALQSNEETFRQNRALIEEITRLKAEVTHLERVAVAVQRLVELCV